MDTVRGQIILALLFSLLFIPVINWIANCDFEVQKVQQVYEGNINLKTGDFRIVVE